MKRESFGSRLGFILVSAGCAIGIGNVRKFPYICGAYGGAAFILIYLCFLVILGIPVLVAEFAVGRGSHTSVAKCFDKLAPAGSCWKPLKFIGIIGCYMLMMFYTTVARARPPATAAILFKNKLSRNIRTPINVQIQAQRRISSPISCNGENSEKIS